MNNSYPDPSAYGPSLPPEVVKQIITLSEGNRFLAAENMKLENRLERIKQREDAYTKIMDLGDNRTWICGRNGIPQELLNCKIIKAYRITSQPPLHSETIYEIKITGHEPLSILESDFLNDRRLLNAFQQHGIYTYIVKNLKTTAILIRQAINEQLEQYAFNNYAGWYPDGSNQFTYWIFSKFSTHCQFTQDDFNGIKSLPPQPPAVAATATQQFLTVFNPICNGFLRQTVILLYHEAALHTLLQQLNYHLPLSFCLFATDESILAYLRHLLSWFSDPPLTLDTPSKTFTNEILFRKDQPLLIEDRGRLDHAERNVSTLESALINGSILWKDGRSTQYLPLQAPVIFLSSRPSRLSIAPEIIALDFSTEDIDRTAWLEIVDRISQNQEYLTAFCGYTMKHIAELQKALSDGQKTALRFTDSQLTEDSYKMLGIFIGLQNFLESFLPFQWCRISIFPRLQRIF